jgi:hypothetical protein
MCSGIGRSDRMNAPLRPTITPPSRAHRWTVPVFSMTSS